LCITVGDAARPVAPTVMHKEPTRHEDPAS
jgi:hypothetical protein